LRSEQLTIVPISLRIAETEDSRRADSMKVNRCYAAMPNSETMQSACPDGIVFCQPPHSSLLESFGLPYTMEKRHSPLASQVRFFTVW
jgi:hypothetical protein